MRYINAVIVDEDIVNNTIEIGIMYKNRYGGFYLNYKDIFDYTYELGKYEEKEELSVQEVIEELINRDSNIKNKVIIKIVNKGDKFKYKENINSLFWPQVIFTCIIIFILDGINHVFHSFFNKA